MGLKALNVCRKNSLLINFWKSTNVNTTIVCIVTRLWLAQMEFLFYIFNIYGLSYLGSMRLNMNFIVVILFQRNWPQFNGRKSKEYFLQQCEKRWNQTWAL
jgi:hypothetical protein